MSIDQHATGVEAIFKCYLLLCNTTVEATKDDDKILQYLRTIFIYSLFATLKWCYLVCYAIQIVISNRTHHQ